MPFNGSGTFSIINTFVPSTTILSAQVNQNYTDIASGLSTALLKDGTQAITATIPFSLASSLAVPVRIVSTNADANAGPILELYRDSASPLAADVGPVIYFYGEDSAGNKQKYAGINSVFEGVTSTTENGRLLFYLTVNGTDTPLLNLFATSLTPQTNDGLALGTSSLGYSDLFLASGAVVNWNAGDVTITHSANTLAFAGASTGYTFAGAVAVTSASGSLGPISLTSTDGVAGSAAMSFSINNGTTSGVVGNVTYKGAAAAIIGVDYNTTSDGRRKPEEHRRPINDSGAVIDALNPIRFRWDTGFEDFGFIAQEVYEVLPTVVAPGGDDPITQPWQMQKGAMESILVAELQSLRRRVADLEARLR